MKRVVITGIGVISPLGVGTTAFWNGLLSGESGIRTIRQFDASGFACQIAGEIPSFKVGDYVPKSYRKATKLMARDIEIAVIAADDALKNAGIKSKAYSDTPDFDSLRFGCNIGAGLISAELNELAAAMHVARGSETIDLDTLDLAKWGREGMSQLTPLWLLKYLPNMLSCHVTIIHGLCGPSNTITCADASSHLAIGEAFRTLQRGKADLAICGGAESKINPMGVIRQTLLKRLNESSNDRPTEALRPFDKNGNGTIAGEGGGLLILEEYERAKNRGATIYAELIGFAASQDTYSVTEPDPSGLSYGKAIEKAIKDAGQTPGDVDLLIPHGLGIEAFDKSELAGIKSAFGSELSRIAFAPIKGGIGNLAAGCGVDAAAAVMALHTGHVPGSPNTTDPIDSSLNLSTTARDLKPEIAVSSVYSLGGQNAALVFKKVTSGV